MKPSFFFLFFFFVFYASPGWMGKTPYVVSGQVPATRQETEDFNAIRSLYEKDFFKVSLNEIVSFRKKYPGSFYGEDLTFYEAVLLLNTGEKSAALKKLSQFVRLYPSGKYLEDALFYKGAAETDLKLSERSIRTFHFLTEKFPDTDYFAQINYYRVKAGFYKEDWEYTQNYSDAIADTDKLNDIQRTDLEYIRLWLTIETGTPDASASVYSRIAENPAYSKHQKKLLSLHIGRKRLDKMDYHDAIIYFQRALDYKTDDDAFSPEIHFYLGSAYFKVATALKNSSADTDKNNAPDNTSDEKAQKNGMRLLENSLVLNAYQSSIAAHKNNVQATVPFQPEYSTYQIARIYFEQKKYALARETGLKLIQKSSPFYKNPSGYSLLYLIDRALEKDDRALKYLSRSIELTKEKDAVLTLRLERIRLSHSLNHCETVAWDSSELLKSRLPNIKNRRHEIISYTAYCKLNEKKYKKAAELYAKIPVASEYHSSNAPAYLRALKHAGNQKKYNQLLQSIDPETLITDSAYSQFIYNSQIEALIASKKWTAARRKITAAKKKFPDNNPTLFYYSGQVWLKTGRSKRAEADFLEAYRTVPKNQKKVALSYAQSLIDLHKKNNRHAKLIAVYKSVLPLIDSKKQRGQIMLLVANTYAKKLKKNTPALEWYGKLLKKGSYPYNVEAALEATDIYLTRSDIKNAQGVLTIILKRKLKNTQYYAPVTFKLGAVYHYNEKYKRALHYYNEAMKASPGSTEGKEAAKRAKTISAYLKKR